MKKITKLLRNILQNSVENKLFNKGIFLFNKKKYYDAHEFWEELWSEHKLDDPLFIQGLIQLSVAFFHISNLNLKCSRSLFQKCLPKLKSFPFNHRNLNLSEIINCSQRCYEEVNSIEKSFWKIW